MPHHTRPCLPLGRSLLHREEFAGDADGLALAGGLLRTSSYSQCARDDGGNRISIPEG